MEIGTAGKNEIARLQKELDEIDSVEEQIKFVDTQIKEWNDAFDDKGDINGGDTAVETDVLGFLNSKKIELEPLKKQAPQPRTDEAAKQPPQQLSLPGL